MNSISVKTYAALGFIENLENRDLLIYQKRNSNFRNDINLEFRDATYSPEIQNGKTKNQSVAECRIILKQNISG